MMVENHNAEKFNFGNVLLKDLLLLWTPECFDADDDEGGGDDDEGGNGGGDDDGGGGGDGAEWWWLGKFNILLKELLLLSTQECTHKGFIFAGTSLMIPASSSVMMNQVRI